MQKKKAINNDSHEWLNAIAEQKGDEAEIYYEIANSISKHEAWEKYVENIIQ